MGDTELLKSMGQRIMLKRKAMSLTQEELAERMGVSCQMISNLELGKKAVRPENLVKISKELNLSADFILCGANADCEVAKIADKLIQLTPEQLKAVGNMVDFLIDK